MASSAITGQKRSFDSTQNLPAYDYDPSSVSLGFAVGEFRDALMKKIHQGRPYAENVKWTYQTFSELMAKDPYVFPMAVEQATVVQKSPLDDFFPLKTTSQLSHVTQVITFDNGPAEETVINTEPRLGKFTVRHIGGHLDFHMLGFQIPRDTLLNTKQGPIIFDALMKQLSTNFYLGFINELCRGIFNTPAFWTSPEAIHSRDCLFGSSVESVMLMRKKTHGALTKSSDGITNLLDDADKIMSLARATNVAEGVMITKEMESFLSRDRRRIVASMAGPDVAESNSRDYVTGINVKDRFVKFITSPEVPGDEIQEFGYEKWMKDTTAYGGFGAFKNVAKSMEPGEYLTSHSDIEIPDPYTNGFRRYRLLECLETCVWFIGTRDRFPIHAELDEDPMTNPKHISQKEGFLDYDLLSQVAERLINNEQKPGRLYDPNTLTDYTHCPHLIDVFLRFEPVPISFRDQLGRDIAGAPFWNFEAVRFLGEIDEKNLLNVDVVSMARNLIHHNAKAALEAEAKKHYDIFYADLPREILEYVPDETGFVQVTRQVQTSVVIGDTFVHHMADLRATPNVSSQWDVCNDTYTFDRVLRTQTEKTFPVYYPNFGLQEVEFKIPVNVEVDGDVFRYSLDKEGTLILLMRRLEIHLKSLEHLRGPYTPVVADFMKSIYGLVLKLKLDNLFTSVVRKYDEARPTFTADKKFYFKPKLAFPTVEKGGQYLVIDKHYSKAWFKLIFEVKDERSTEQLIEQLQSSYEPEKDVKVLEFNFDQLVLNEGENKEYVLNEGLLLDIRKVCLQMRDQDTEENFDDISENVLLMQIRVELVNFLREHDRLDASNNPKVFRIAVVDILKQNKINTSQKRIDETLMAANSWTASMVEFFNLKQTKEFDFVLIPVVNTLLCKSDKVEEVLDEIANEKAQSVTDRLRNSLRKSVYVDDYDEDFVLSVNYERLHNLEILQEAVADQRDVMINQVTMEWMYIKKSRSGILKPYLTADSFRRTKPNVPPNDTVIWCELINRTANTRYQDVHDSLREVKDRLLNSIPENVIRYLLIPIIMKIVSYIQQQEASENPNSTWYFEVKLASNTPALSHSVGLASATLDEFSNGYNNETGNKYFITKEEYVPPPVASAAPLYPLLPQGNATQPPPQTQTQQLQQPYFNVNPSVPQNANTSALTPTVYADQPQQYVAPGVFPGAYPNPQSNQGFFQQPYSQYVYPSATQPVLSNAGASADAGLPTLETLAGKHRHLRGRLEYSQTLHGALKGAFELLCVLPVSLPILRILADHNVPLPFLGQLNEDSQTQVMTSVPCLAKGIGNQLIHETGLQKHVRYQPKPADMYVVEGGVNFGVSVQRREGIFVKDQAFGNEVVGGFGNGFINELPDGTFVSHLSHDFHSIVLPRVANGSVQGPYSKIFAVGPLNQHEPERWCMSSTGYYRPQDFSADMNINLSNDFKETHKPHYVGQAVINHIFQVYRHHQRDFTENNNLSHLDRRFIARTNNIMLNMPVRRYSSKTREYEIDTPAHLWGNFGTNCREYITSQIPTNVVGGLQESLYHNPEPTLTLPN